MMYVSHGTDLASLLEQELSREDYNAVFNHPENYRPEELLLLIYRYRVEGYYRKDDQNLFALDDSDIDLEKRFPPLIEAVLPDRLSSFEEDYHPYVEMAYEHIASVQRSPLFKILFYYSALLFRPRFYKSILEEILDISDGKSSSEQRSQINTILQDICLLDYLDESDLTLLDHQLLTYADSKRL